MTRREAKIRERQRREVARQATALAAALRDPELRSIHPGVMLRRHYVESGDHTVGALAEKLGVARPHLSRVLGGHASLSPEMAIRFEETFGERARDLLRVQVDYDLAMRRRIR